MLSVINEDLLLWFYSVVAQVFGALLALISVFVVFKLQEIRGRIRVYANTARKTYSDLCYRNPDNEKDDKFEEEVALRAEEQTGFNIYSLTIVRLLKALQDRAAVYVSDSKCREYLELRKAWLELACVKKIEENTNLKFQQGLILLTSCLMIGIAGTYLSGFFQSDDVIFRTLCISSLILIFILWSVVRISFLMWAIVNEMPDAEYVKLRDSLKSEFDKRCQESNATNGTVQG